MSKNVTINGTNYEEISIVELPLTDGSGSGLFKDTDEISSSGMNLIGTFENSEYSGSAFTTWLTKLDLRTSYENGMFLIRNNDNVLGGEINGLITAVIIYSSEHVLSQLIGNRVGNSAFQSSAQITTRTNKEVGGLIGVDMVVGTAHTNLISPGQSTTIYEMPLPDVSWFLNNYKAEETTE